MLGRIATWIALRVDAECAKGRQQLGSYSSEKEEDPSLDGTIRCQPGQSPSEKRARAHVIADTQIEDSHIKDDDDD